MGRTKDLAHEELSPEQHQFRKEMIEFEQQVGVIILDNLQHSLNIELSQGYKNNAKIRYYQNRIEEIKNQYKL